MTDPTRLLDDLATDSAARSALLAGRADRGPAHRREQLWAALAPQLPLDPSSLGQPAAPPLDPSAGALGQAAAPSSAATSTAATGTTAAVTSGSTAGATGAASLGAATTGAAPSTLSAAGGIGALLKAAAAGAGAVGALLGAQALLTPAAPPATLPPAAVSASAPARPEVPYRSPAPTVTAPSVAATASADAAPSARVDSPRPLAPPPAQVRATADVPADVPPAAPVAASTASAAPGPGEVADRVLQEAELVRRADQALRSGDSSGATRLLDEASQRFPGGVLGQEREVLAIEALARSGQGDAASARARAFLRAHPASPFASRLQPLTR